MADEIELLRENKWSARSNDSANFDVSDFLHDRAYKRVFPVNNYEQIKSSTRIADGQLAHSGWDGLTDDQQLKLMESDVRTYGKQPTAELTQLMRDNQVVGIGDGHGLKEPQQTHAGEYLQALKDGGATHLVIEAPPSSKEMLDEFNRSGNLDVSKLPIFSRNSEYVAMLKAAHAAGLTVVAGDSEHGTNTSALDRNPTMASTIEDILRGPGQDPQHPNKVAFWVGAEHLGDYHRAQSSYDLTAAEILRRDQIELATVAYHDGHNPKTLAERAASVVSEPTMISTTKAKNFGQYADGSHIRENSWDHLILYPER